MPMKTILEKGSHGGPDNALRQRNLTSTTVLVPMLNLSVATDLIQLAAVLALGPHRRERAGPTLPTVAQGRIVVVGVVEVPADQPLTTGLVMARSYRALLDFLPSEVEVDGKRVRVDRIVKVSRDVPSAVHQAAIDEQAGLVLLYWKGHSNQSKRYTYGRIADSILKNPPCDVALLRPEAWRESRKVVLPVRGGPSAERALDLAVALAEYLHLPVTVMHNVPSVSQADKLSASSAGSTLVETLGEEPYLVFNQYLKAVEEEASAPIERILTVGTDPVASLLAEVRQSDFVVMGAPQADLAAGADQEPSIQMSFPLRVSEEKGPPLLLLHTHEPLDFAHYRKKLRHPESAHRARKSWDDMPFEHWFVENTFHGDEFKDPGAFVEAKRRSGLSISVALLTSNDAAHIYSAITGLKKVLMEMHPLVDQIAVVDAGSADGTADIARSLGVEVYACRELIPETGDLHGRGESWWKSLAALRGDVLVWLDARAPRFHPSTAMCLAGPLLRVPTLQFVKAYGQPQATTKSKIGVPSGPPKSKIALGGADYAPVDMSWGGFVMPNPGSLEQSANRIRVQALRPEDLQALTPGQIATLPPRTILQVLCPSLAGVIAPFSRDFAGRRTAMLSMPAFIGDSLEAGLLLSVAAEYGTRAVAQVELRHAQPSPPPQPALNNAIDILQVLSRRLQDPAMRRYAAENAERLQKSIEGKAASSTEDEFGPVFEVRALGLVERPPILPIIT